MGKTDSEGGMDEIGNRKGGIHGKGRQGRRDRWEMNQGRRGGWERKIGKEGWMGERKKLRRDG